MKTHQRHQNTIRRLKHHSIRISASVLSAHRLFYTLDPEAERGASPFLSKLALFNYMCSLFWNYFCLYTGAECMRMLEIMSMSARGESAGARSCGSLSGCEVSRQHGNVAGFESDF